MDERNDMSEPLGDGTGPAGPPDGAEPLTPDIDAEFGSEPEAGAGAGAWTPAPSPYGPYGGDLTPQTPPADPAYGPYGPYGPYGGMYPPGPAGGPAGGPPGPMGAIGPYGSSQEEPPRRHRGLVIGAAVAAGLLLVGAGAGIAVGLSGGSSPKVTASRTVDNTSPRSGATLHTGTIASRVNPAVVDINTVVELPGGTAEAAGTGMIVSSNGYILTNNHVVEDATSIKVTIHGQAQKVVATFVGADPSADVAVIKVSGLNNLPVVSFGNSSSLAVGDPVVAIGNALGLGGAPTVTTGTISALGRSINASDSTGSSEHLTGMIETDAPIEPGNSGGPLVDASGNVIGMDTAAASAAGSNGSVGFALPINRVAPIAASITQGRHSAGVVLGLPPFLGIDGQNVNLLGQQAAHGVNIVDVVPGTPAAQAGIQPGDVILKFNGTATPTIQSLSALIHKLHPGSAASVTYQSQFGIRTVTVHLVAGPAA